MIRGQIFAQRDELSLWQYGPEFFEGVWDLRLDCYQGANTVLEGRKILFDINRRSSPSSSPCQGEADTSAPGEGLLEQSRDGFGETKKIIDATCRNSGWLIFATHDVCDNPRPMAANRRFLKMSYGIRPIARQRFYQCRKRWT